MFQSSETTARPEQGSPHLTALRAEPVKARFAAFIGPLADAHQGE